MNLIKATIATAAVITCCLGNELPAQANDAAMYEQALRICLAAFELNTTGIAAGPNSTVWKHAMRTIDSAQHKRVLDHWNYAKREIPSCNAIF